jgi:hypothetical protein
MARKSRPTRSTIQFAWKKMAVCSCAAPQRQFDMLARVIEAFSIVDHTAATDIMRR